MRARSSAGSRDQRTTDLSKTNTGYTGVKDKALHALGTIPDSERDLSTWSHAGIVPNKTTLTNLTTKSNGCRATKATTPGERLRVWQMPKAEAPKVQLRPFGRGGNVKKVLVSMADGKHS